MLRFRSLNTRSIRNKNNDLFSGIGRTIVVCLWLTSIHVATVLGEETYRPGVIIAKLRSETADAVRPAVANKVPVQALPIPATLQTLVAQYGTTEVKPIVEP